MSSSALVNSRSNNMDSKMDDVDLHRLLGKHDIDTSVFDRSLKRLAMTTDNSKLAVVEVIPEEYPEEPVSGLVSSGYKTNLEMAIGNAVDKTILRAEKQNLNEISTFSRKGLRHAIVTAFDDKLVKPQSMKLIENNQQVSLFKIHDKTSNIAKIQTQTPFLPGNPLANRFCAIIEDDAYVKSLSNKEFIEAHMDVVNKHEAKVSEVDLWKLVQDICLLESREEYPNLALKSLQDEFQYYITQAFPNSSGISLTKDIIINFLNCLKKENDEVGKSLKYFSDSLQANHNEAIDPNYNLNIYALIYYHLRSGLFKETLSLLQHWKDINILPIEEEFLIDVVSCLIDKKQISKYSTNSTVVLVKILALQTSPWKLALFQLFEGSQMNDTLKLVYSSIQDYIWQNLFIHNNIHEINNIGEDIVNLTSDYFKNIGDDLFYAKLLMQTLQLEQACWFLYNKFQDDMGSLSFTIHLIICLNRSSVLNTFVSSFNKLQTRNQNDFLQKDNLNCKKIAFSKIVYNFTYLFINTKLSTAIAYLSSLSSNRDDVSQIVDLLGHLLAESNQISYLLDDFKPKVIVPTLYSRKGKVRKESNNRIGLITKRNGLLHQVKTLQNSVIEDIIKKSVELSNLDRNYLLSFNLLLRSQLSSNQVVAIEGLLGTNLVDANESLKDKWYEIVLELDESDIDYQIVKSIYVPYTKFQLALKQFKEEIVSPQPDEQLLFKEYQQCLYHIKDLVPMDINLISAAVSLFSNFRKETVSRLFVSALTDSIKATEEVTKVLKANGKIERYSLQLKSIIQCQTALFSKFDLTNPTLARTLSKLQLFIQ